MNKRMQDVEMNEGSERSEKERRKLKMNNEI